MENTPIYLLLVLVVSVACLRGPYSSLSNFEIYEIAISNVQKDAAVYKISPPSTGLQNIVYMSAKTAALKTMKSPIDHIPEEYSEFVAKVIFDPIKEKAVTGARSVTVGLRLITLLEGLSIEWRADLLPNKKLGDWQFVEMSKPTYRQKLEELKELKEWTYQWGKEIYKHKDKKWTFRLGDDPNEDQYKEAKEILSRVEKMSLRSCLPFPSSSASEKQDFQLFERAILNAEIYAEDLAKRDPVISKKDKWFVYRLLLQEVSTSYSMEDAGFANFRLKYPKAKYLASIYYDPVYETAASSDKDKADKAVHMVDARLTLNHRGLSFQWHAKLLPDGKLGEWRFVEMFEWIEVNSRKWTFKWGYDPNEEKYKEAKEILSRVEKMSLRSCLPFPSSSASEERK